MNDGDPHYLHVSYEAERSILGGIMLTEGRALTDVLDLITTNDFHSPANRAIYDTILKLDDREQKSDVLTVREQLQRDGALNVVGGNAYISEIVEETASAANIAAYAKIVRERSIRRQLVQANQKIRELSEDGRPIEEVLSDAQRVVLQVGVETLSEGPQPISKWVPNYINTLDTRQHRESKIVGLTTGFKDLDQKIHGLQSGQLIVVAGRPSMGKTALAMNIARHVSMVGELPTITFSMEMDAEEILQRMVSQVGKVPLHTLMSGDLDEKMWNQAGEALERLGKTHHMDLDESPALVMSQIKARCRRMIQRHGKLGIIVVDYLQLMGSESRSDMRAQQISEITRGLKALAKELRTPVVVLSQLNREVDKRENKRPRMSDLRESGSIEQDADVIIFVYRDVVYDENTRDPKVAEIIIGKQRNGPTGTVLLYFFGEYVMFGQMAIEDQQSFWEHQHSKSQGRRYAKDDPF